MRGMTWDLGRDLHLDLELDGVVHWVDMDLE